MRTIENVMILASAGSGKTYALTNRFVQLLALGAKPDRIVALTFTRKAAGEFFDEILKKLARAASEPEYAAQLAIEIGVPRLGVSQFLELLRSVVRTMHRLSLGTFDGFFGRIARNFPLELGLSGDFEILQAHAARIERARVLRRMFERTGELGDAQREFIEAFKRATFGADEKRLGAQLDAFLDEHQEIFLSAPIAEAWGNAKRIWPDGGRWLEHKASAAKSLQALGDWVAAANLQDKQRLRWTDFIEAWGRWSPGVVPDRPLEYVLEKALAAWSELERGSAVLEFDRKKQNLTPLACAALADLTRHVVAAEIGRRLEVTRGIHAVLQGYEAIYHDAVRRTGKLTFGDVQRLLVPGEDRPYALSQDADDERRLFIDFRLDAEIDHWLLDEFQDTSHGQWSVLRNLIDEALQDPTGSRSLFYVGDVKQAIFAWREGDPRLFREIYEAYNTARPGTISEQHLVKSWRSGPAIINTVNRVFGDNTVLGEMFDGEAARTWNREWRAHESAQPELGGHVALFHADDEMARFGVTLEILREIDPLARGLSCALLVQSNLTASRLAEYLRREGGYPAIADADLHVCIDNPLGAALLALVKAAAYPGDTLAGQHVRMTPLGALLTEDGLNTSDALTTAVLGQVHAEGFERTMVSWTRRLLTVVGVDDQFGQLRGRQLGAAAALFDQSGSRDVGEFIQFMESHTVRDTDEAAVVRVMTIHKSKGLGFDVVVLPDLEGVKLDCRRDGLAVQKSAAREVEWILDLPGKLFHAQDEVLSAHVKAAEANACYENLSLLYVAMTRAKRAMYLITKPVGTSVSRNYPKLLAETLGENSTGIQIGGASLAGAFAEGDSQWYLSLKPTEEHVNPGPAVPMPVAPAAPARKSARSPSAAGRLPAMGAHLFSLDRRAGRAFGTQVHALLAEIEWGGPANAARFREWRTRALPESVVREAIACVESPGLVDVWTQRSETAIWRERPFEVLVDGAWISGTFDRVLVHYDAAHRPVAADVIDFKTDRVGHDLAPGDSVLKHRPQMELYARVAGILTQLPAEKISSWLVFTGLREMLRVHPRSESG
ncbi:MAG: UvrD-helicase domain-containing protein [Opitutus sp.]